MKTFRDICFDITVELLGLQKRFISSSFFNHPPKSPIGQSPRFDVVPIFVDKHANIFVMKDVFLGSEKIPAFSYP
jgi:hypothetical protein